MKYTIKDLSEGRVAVINDGTGEELNQVLKLAFPNDKYSIPTNTSYFSRNSFNHTFWGVGSGDLPTQSVKDFLNMKTVTRQQLVQIYNIACEGWKAKIEKMIPFDKDEVNISQEQIDEMFKAATPDQKPTLEEIFGKQEERMVQMGDRVTSEEMSMYRGSHIENNYIVINLPEYGWALISLENGNRWTDKGIKSSSDTISLRKLING